MTEPKILSIIPARGGSERVPRKNLIAFACKPLLAWTIEASLGAAGVGRTVVSTDDAEIKQVALSYGAEVIDRPAELSHARSTSEAALVHALDHLREREGYVPDIVIFLQATSPLRDAHDIDAAIEKLLAEGADSLLTGRDEDCDERCEELRCRRTRRHEGCARNIVREVQSS